MQQKTSDLIGQRQERIDKAAKLRELGIDPYGTKAHRSHMAREIVDNFERLENNNVTVSGRLMSWREHGQIIFGKLQDQSGQIQLYIKSEVLNSTDSDKQTIGFNDLKLIDVGDLVEGEGKVVKTQTGEISVLVENFRILTKTLRPLPDKWAGLKDKEALYRQRYLDMIMNPEKRWRFEKAAQILFALREFLNSKGFLEIKTPILQPLYGGGLAKPFTTKVNALDTDFYLAISHELYLKRLIVAGFENVFNFVGYFRNEGIDRSHNPEFTMLETMTAFHNYEYNMELIENMYKYVGEKVFNKTNFKINDQEIDFGRPWERMKMIDAVKKYTGLDFDEIKTLEDAQRAAGEQGVEKKQMSIGECMSEVFKLKVEPQLIQPTFIYGHPVEISPLAKRMPEDSRFVERFEIFIGGMEGGDNWTELNDPLELYERFKAQAGKRSGGDDETHPMDLDFLETMEFGMPPTTGLGPGIERLTMMYTETDYIDEVIFFPLMKPAPMSETQKKIYPEAAALVKNDQPKQTAKPLEQNINLKVIGAVKNDNSLVEITPEVLEKFPGIKLGYVVFEGVNVEKSNPSVQELKLKVEEEVKSRYSSKPEMKKSKNLSGYREIYKAFGADPDSRQNSSEALINRIISGKSIYNVNNVVDTYNATSAELELSMAAYDLDQVQGKMSLKFAAGGETIKKIGEDEDTTINAGELIYTDDSGVTCVDWNYRDADRTKVTENTKKIIVFVDGHKNISDDEILNALGIVVMRLEDFTGAKATSFGLIPGKNTRVGLQLNINNNDTMVTPENYPSFADSEKLIMDNVQDPYQRYHAYMIAHCMKGYAALFQGEDANLWEICGMVHDWDYEFDPDGHPENNVDKLKEKGYPQVIIDAIMGHKPDLGTPRNTKMAQALLATDEMAGLIFAYSKLKGSYDTMEVKSVLKKFKDKGFAAKVSRDDISLGIQELGITLEEHTQNLLNILKSFDRPQP